MGRVWKVFPSGREYTFVDQGKSSSGRQVYLRQPAIELAGVESDYLYVSTGPTSWDIFEGSVDLDAPGDAVNAAVDSATVNVDSNAMLSSGEFGKGKSSTSIATFSPVGADLVAANSAVAIISEITSEFQQTADTAVTVAFRLELFQVGFFTRCAS